MDIIKKLEDTFLGFIEEDYIKLFISIKGQDTNILLSFINLSHIDTIKRYFKDFFVFKNNNLYLVENYNTPHLISEAFTFFAMELEQKEGIKMRHEQMLLQSEDAKYSLGYIDRSIVHIFGCKARGVHLNAYVEKLEDGELKRYLWVAKRSSKKLHDPNKLDNLVAGAISLGFSPFETLKKEAQEEAGISAELIGDEKNTINVKTVENQGTILSATISYKSMQYGGLRNYIVNIYTLKLPISFNPIAVDAEVDCFFLMPAEQVLDMLINNFDAFKYNSALVILYFLASNGYIKDIKLNKFLADLFLNLSIY